MFRHNSCFSIDFCATELIVVSSISFFYSHSVDTFGLGQVFEVHVEIAQNEVRTCYTTNLISPWVFMPHSFSYSAIFDFLRVGQVLLLHVDEDVLWYRQVSLLHVGRAVAWMLLEKHLSSQGPSACGCCWGGNQNCQPKLKFWLYLMMRHHWHRNN